MGDVMEFDMRHGGNRGRPPPRIASRLASGRRSSGAKSTDAPLRAKPPSGRADAKGLESGPITAKRPSASSVDSFGTRERDSLRRGRGSSDDEAAAKPRARRADSPTGYGRVGSQRRGSFDAGIRGVDEGKFRLGQKVEGRFRGKGRWYKGRIIGVKGGGKYDVRYVDGDEDLDLDSSAIKSEGVDADGGDSISQRRNDGRQGGTGARRVPSPRIGDPVEARVPGTTRWQGATVVGENRNGTLDVRLRDGVEEKQLEPSMIRALGESGGIRGERARDSRGGNDSTSDVEPSSSRAIGGEARRPGSRSPGRRVISGGGSDSDLGHPSFREGNKIEARYKRGRKWYPGVIQAVNRDGSVDIKYKDGDREYDVEPALVRSLGAASANSLATSNSSTSDVTRRSDFAVGEKVEARFGGRTRWFKATVDAKNRDGSYVLTYDDGDVERRVESDLIRRVEGGASKRSGSRSPGRRVISGIGTDSEADPVRGGKLREGDEIEARYKRGRKWYPGVIQAMNRDGTMDIKYKDGDREYDVEAGLVRSLGTASTASLATSNSAASVTAHSSHRSSDDFAVGEKVEARFGGRTRWFKATVDAKNRDGSYVLTYDDGDVERRVESDLIRRVQGGTGKGSRSRSPGRQVVSGIGTDSETDPVVGEKVREGDEVEARYKQGRKWYPGVVQAMNRDGTMDIKYKDGDREYDVEASMIRGKKGADSVAASAGDVAANEEFAEGDRVEARFGGRSRWLRATVERKNRNGTYWLIYADGDQERAVGADFIRMLGGGRSPQRSNTGSAARRGVSTADRASDLEASLKVNLRVNDDVEARYKGGRKWYRGKIRALNRDGTYDIRYADGDTERDVKSEFIRVTSAASLESATGSDDFVEGEKVEARFGGRSRWFRGTVERRNRDGSYRVQYVDGDEELAVEKHLMRRVGAKASSPAGSRSPGRRVVSGVESGIGDAARKASRVGDDVEARYKRGRRWFPGKVRTVNRDGTMDIKYKDGDSERDVEPGFVRSLGAASTTSLATSTSAASETARAGDRRRVGEGDQGRRNLRDKTNSIDSLTSKAGHDRGRSYDIGDKVEARFRGGSRWYKATVERENADGSYYLIFEDGDKERAVDKSMIRSLGKVSGEFKRDENNEAEVAMAHRVGDVVEARYKRGLKWYEGTVRRVSRDGTMDVEYKDGDFERDVGPAFVRQIDGAGAGETSRALTVGDKVEGRFGGGPRWFKATIERNNRDGTFSLLYIDGDKERAVERELIRKIDGGGSGGRRSEKENTRDNARRVTARASSETGTDIDQEEGKNSDRGEFRDKAKSGNPPRPGDVVEARLRGGSRWLIGEATRIHRDGSYDVEYDGGQSERNVPASHVRLPAKKTTRSSDSSNSSDSERRNKDGGNKQAKAIAIVEGDRVEARLRGHSTWHGGEVTKVHSDGTFDVRYSRNGEVEKRVKPRLVRRPLSDASGARIGGPRARSRGRTGADSSSDAPDSGRGNERGNREPTPQDSASEDAEAAATKVRRALRHAGKTVDDFARKLERVRRASGGRDSRGRSVMGNVDKNAFEGVLAGVGAKLSAHESRALRRFCPDIGNNGCVDPSALASLVRGRSGSPTKRRRSSSSRTRRGRSPSSGSAAASVQSASDSAVGATAARPQRVRRKDRSRSRSRSRHREGSTSSLDHASSGSTSDRRRYRDKRDPGSEHRSPSTGKGRGDRTRSIEEAGTSSESGGNGETPYNSREGGSTLVGNATLRALKKLEGPAVDGSLRREYERLSGGRERELSTSRLKPLLRRFRIKLEEPPLAEVITIIDPNDVGSFSLKGILEAALSTVEEKEISKIHKTIWEQLFKPSGRGRGKGRKASQEAEAASTAVSKMFSKLEHPKGSGLLVTSDLKKSFQKASAKISSGDTELLAERLDPDNRGKVDREALVLWLTSGFDTARAELRASVQLRLLKAKKNVRKPVNAFREFDQDHQGVVRHNDFVAALGKLGLVLTHGQAIALATRHHNDYERFLVALSDTRRGVSEEEETVSEGSDSSGSRTKGQKRRKSWMESLGGRRRGSSNSSKKKRKDGGGVGEGDSSDGSDGPLTSGSSSEAEKEGDEEGGLLLGARARAALRDAFELVCSAGGGVKEIFCSATAATESQDALSGREETRRFLRRLKLDVADEDRAALLDALAGPRCSSDISGHSSRVPGERGVSFESDEGRKKRAKRGGQGGAGGKSEADGEGGGGGATRILYRDFLELVLADQESKEISKIHGRMSKDLARAADRSSKPIACPFSLVVKALSKHDPEETGFVKASDFKRSLEKLGYGGLSSAEKSLLVRRFDPAEEGMINYEAFGAWLSSGLDPKRLVAKLGRLLGQLTGKGTRSKVSSGSGTEIDGRKHKLRGDQRAREKARKHLLKVGVRGLFEDLDEDAAGTISRHDMKVVLRRTLGLPLTEGDLRALFKRLDKDGNGMLDYEELLALASKKERSDRDGGIRHRNNGILSKLKEKGSAIVRGAPGKKGLKRQSDSNGSSAESDASNKGDHDHDEDEGEEGGDTRRRTGRDGEKKKKRKQKEKKEGKGKAKKHKGGERESADGRRGSTGRNGVDSAMKGARLEIKLMRLRISILQQSAATATASAAQLHEGEGHSDGSGDEKNGGGENAGGGISAAAVTARWTAMFEARDRAGTGRATLGDLQAVLEKAGVKMLGDDVSLLASTFAAHPFTKGSHRGSREGNEQEGEEETQAGDGSVRGTSLPPAAIDYDGFVRWLSEGGGLDDALLGKVQRHLKARLSKAMDLRALFTEMCDGNSGSGSGGSRTSKRRDRKSTKETLSSSSLARGLRHAGLPLDRAVVKLLVAAFSVSEAGCSGGRKRRHHHLMSYADFHRMVHCDGLLAVGSTNPGAGSETLDEQIRSKLLETVERAFAFYDEDNANSIDATEVVNILRALGHDLTRGESRALLRKANVDRNGTVEFEGFQEAVMPFLLERAHSKRRTEGEMRAMFDEIDPDRSGTIKREEFAYLFCSKLRLLSHKEAEALLSLLDRHSSGQISWEEFVKLFELVDDRTGGGGIAALPADLKEIVAIALRKLQMGALPDVEGQLSSFLGMPSSCRKSVLAPLDHIKELGLQWVLMPKLDSRGCIQLQDMSVKVTTEVAEVEASKAPPEAQGQVLVKTANLADRASDGGKSKKTSPSKSLAATLGFGKRDKSPPPAISESKGTKTRRRSSILGAGLMETTTTVMKRATLQEVGASTEEGGSGGRGGGGGRSDDSVNGGGVAQVELSVKHAFGIPVARDSRLGDIRQRGMRACLFYDAGREVDKNTGEASSEYGEHFLCNTYKTLAIQHPQKEEQWLFPDSSEGERKFLIRTDFGCGSGAGHPGHRRRRSSSDGNKRHQGTRDQSPPLSSSVCGDRKRLFLLVELTCTVQTAAMVDGRDSYSDGAEGGGRMRVRGGDGAVRGPLKNFRSGGSRKRVGGIRRRGRGDDDDSCSHDSTEGSSLDCSEDGSKDDDGDSESRSGKSSRSDTDGDSDSNSGTEKGNNQRPRREKKDRSSIITREERRRTRGRNQDVRKRARNAKSAPPRPRGRGGRHGVATRVSRNRGGVRSERPSRTSRRRNRNRSSSSNGSSGEEDSRSGDNRSSSDSRRANRARKNHKSGAAEKRVGSARGGGSWRGSWGGSAGDKRRGRRRNGSGDQEVDGEGEDDIVEVEMSCGWVLIPFLELVEAHEVKKVRYKLLGGTPFAKTDINEDEVMTRRYGWRAVLKAMKIEGMHKGSEVEIKILPVNTLSKLKQDDIFRLPRNVILSDTFVSLVRHYREYAANSLAKRSARGMGNVGFGAGSASSEPVLALFPRLAADPALMMALKNQWEAEVRKTHVDGRLGATLSGKLIGLGLGGGGGGVGAGGLTGVTGAAREACLIAAFEKAVMRLWPAFCHIDAQRRRGSAGKYGAESYEELESRGQRIRQILDSTDSFHSDTPTNASSRGEAGGGRKGIVGGTSPSAVSQEGRVMVAFTLKEVAFDVA